MKRRVSRRRSSRTARDRKGRSRTEVKSSALEPRNEALRMRQCPGIYFCDEPSGRTAKIDGTGLGVWEVVRDFAGDTNVGRIRGAFPQLSQAQIASALTYYGCYRDEVQARIDANAALTPEAIEKQYPGLICFTR